MTDKRNRAPKGTPAGGEFAKNEHDEASGTMSESTDEPWYDYADQEPVSRREREHASFYHRREGRTVEPGEARSLALHIAGESPDYRAIRTFGTFGRVGQHGIATGLEEIKGLRRGGWERGGSHDFERDIDALESFYRAHEV